MTSLLLSVSLCGNLHLLQLLRLPQETLLLMRERLYDLVHFRRHVP
jgi:hypothetical protein